jgi:hypothetical protein
MLKITIDSKARSVEFKLEGKLAGPWVDEFERCWRGATSGARRMSRVELTGVDYVDPAGRELLARIVREGGELLADGPFMAPLVSDIAGEVKRVRRERIHGLAGLVLLGAGQLAAVSAGLVLAAR